MRSKCTSLARYASSGLGLSFTPCSSPVNPPPCEPLCAPGALSLVPTYSQHPWGSLNPNDFMRCRGGEYLICKQDSLFSILMICFIARTDGVASTTVLSNVVFVNILFKLVLVYSIHIFIAPSRWSFWQFDGTLFGVL